jgi:hypothetical protein
MATSEENKSKLEEEIIRATSVYDADVAMRKVRAFLALQAGSQD